MCRKSITVAIAYFIVPQRSQSDGRTYVKPVSPNWGKILAIAVVFVVVFVIVLYAVYWVPIRSIKYTIRRVSNVLCHKMPLYDVRRWHPIFILFFFFTTAQCWVINIWSQLDLPRQKGRKFNVLKWLLFFFFPYYFCIFLLHLRVWHFVFVCIVHQHIP